jgi:hypothetical protein
MARPDRGTVKWFKREKRLIIEYAKAVEAFATAGRNFQKLVDLGHSADAEVRAALHSAGVVNYARPFSNNRPADGGASIIFPKKLIKGHANFSEDIHNQLLDLRHKLIAHSDGDYADGRLFRKIVTVGGGAKPPLKMLAGITVLTQTVHLLHDMAMANRCLSHIKAAEEASYADLQARLEDFAKAGQDFTDAMQAAATSEQRPTIDIGPFEVRPNAPATPMPQVLLNPHAVLTRPPLKLEPDGYAYRGFAVQTDMSAQGTWLAEDGSEVTITLSVPDSSPPPDAIATPTHPQPSKTQDDTIVEKVATTMAVGNNGGSWAEHYAEKHKALWRERAKQVIALVNSA